MSRCIFSSYYLKSILLNTKDYLVFSITIIPIHGLNPFQCDMMCANDK